MSLYADVVINRKITAVDKLFTYRIPDCYAGKIVAGMLVRIPFNREKLEAIVIEVHQRQPQGYQVKEILAPVGERPLFTEELLTLSAWIAEYYLCTRVAVLQAMLPAGLQLSGRPPQNFFITVYHLATPDHAVRLTKERQRLSAYLQAQNGEATAAQLRGAGFSSAVIRGGVKAGLLYCERRRLQAATQQAAGQASPLSQEQQSALTDIEEEWRAADRPCLLHGVTGSGKTEVYLRLIAALAAEGRQSIVLVPEIALSGQMLAMLKERLNVPIAVLHSGLAPSERRMIWQDIAAGKYTVVVGARSAVFAPLPHLGLIVVDEEHESSYKQDNVPRFHAVAVARKRCQLAQAHLLLGSATPSIESYYRAQQGEYRLVCLPHPYYQAPPAWVSVVDMREELRAGNRSIFSVELQLALENCLQQGKQAILFLNRRGYYRFFFLS